MNVLVKCLSVFDVVGEFGVGVELVEKRLGANQLAHLQAVVGVHTHQERQRVEQVGTDQLKHAQKHCHTDIMTRVVQVETDQLKHAQTHCHTDITTGVEQVGTDQLKHAYERCHTDITTGVEQVGTDQLKHAYERCHTDNMTGGRTPKALTVPRFKHTSLQDLQR